MHMTKYHLLPRLALAASMGLPLAAGPAHADEGHDHGPAPATPAGAPAPRFAATSALYELVGVVDGRQLRVYLDRFEDNAPVGGARLDLKLGGATVAPSEHAPGEVEGTLAAELPHGATAVTASVTAAGGTALLAGELDIHDEEPAEQEHAHGWAPHAGWMAAGVAALGALCALAWAARRTRMGAAA
jgi:hypothetical protein